MEGDCTPDSDTEHAARREGVTPIRVRAEIEQHEHDPDECTLFPTAVTELDDLMTTWITAKGEAFVDRKENR